MIILYCYRYIVTWWNVSTAPLWRLLGWLTSRLNGSIGSHKSVPNDRCHYYYCSAMSLSIDLLVIILPNPKCNNYNHSLSAVEFTLCCVWEKSITPALSVSFVLGSSSKSNGIVLICLLLFYPSIALHTFPSYIFYSILFYSIPFANNFRLTRSSYYYTVSFVVWALEAQLTVSCSPGHATLA